MKLVIIGGTGLIGSKLVTRLREQHHEAVPAAPDTGVNTLTGQGLAEALQGASVVVDVSNSPLFEATAVMEFFTTSTRNLLRVHGSSRREALRRTVGGRNRAHTRQSLPPSEERSGSADPGWRHPGRSFAQRSSSSSSSASPMKPPTNDGPAATDTHSAHGG